MTRPIRSRRKDFLRHVYAHGAAKPIQPAPATGACSVFGHERCFELREGFPPVATKKAHCKSIAAEPLRLPAGMPASLHSTSTFLVAPCISTSISSSA
jgi:thymidylate synthase